MILFLYGEDNFRSRQKLNRIREKYLTSSGDVNLVVLENPDIKFEEFKSHVEALPFLVEKRLVVARNFLGKIKKELSEKIVKYLDSVPETTILVFWEEETPDKKGILFSKLNKISKSQEFNLLLGLDLTKWIREEVESLGGEISPLAAELLASYVGNDLWQMNQEIQKLVNFNPEVTAENIEKLVNANLSSNVFNMVDALGQKNSKKALKIMHELLETGENEMYLLTMITRQIRNILLVKDCLSEDFSRYAISKILKLHPFVVQKAIVQAANFSFEELKNIYEKLLETDIAIKTGRLEPILALDLLVVNLTKPSSARPSKI